VFLVIENLIRKKGVKMAKKKRQYPNDYCSVTQALDCLRKIGLEWWFRNNTPQFIEAASKKGKEIGTQTHQAIQDFIEGKDVKVETDYAAEVSFALKSFQLFRKEHPEVTLQNAECMLTHEDYKYNGTLDVVGKIGDVLVIGDWKSQEAKLNDKPKVYDEYKAQLAAYIKAYNFVNKTNIDKGFIVVLAKDKVAFEYYQMEFAEIEAEFDNVFLPALTVCSYRRRNILNKEIK
jgi:CRISPR/Cas system-associated exonuclease Cas4 (RecB family)